MTTFSEFQDYIHNSFGKFYFLSIAINKIHENELSISSRIDNRHIFLDGLIRKVVSPSKLFRKSGQNVQIIITKKLESDCIKMTISIHLKVEIQISRINITYNLVNVHGVNPSNKIMALPYLFRIKDVRYVS